MARSLPNQCQARFVDYIPGICSSDYSHVR